MRLSEKIHRGAVISWIISFLIHLCLLVLFVLIRVFMLPAIPEYSEMDFVSVPTVAHPPVVQKPSVSSPPSGESPLPTPDIPSENIRLPEMKHLPEEQPELFERKVEKIAPNDIPFGGEVEAPAKPSDSDETYPSVQTEGADRKPIPDVQEVAVGEKPQPGMGEGETESQTRPYSIEGAASSRQVITEVLPEYPPGLNKEAVIRIRFTVLPNGTVGEMVPVLKGDQTLEDLTMKAFRQWRFNPLPPDLPQDPQAGVITFRYVLK